MYALVSKLSGSEICEIRMLELLFIYVYILGKTDSLTVEIRFYLAVFLPDTIRV